MQKVLISALYPFKGIWFRESLWHGKISVLSSGFYLQKGRVQITKCTNKETDKESIQNENLQHLVLESDLSHISQQAAGKAKPGMGTGSLCDLHLSLDITALPSAISTQSPSWTSLAHCYSWCWIQKTKSHSCLLQEFPENKKREKKLCRSSLSPATFPSPFHSLNVHKQIRCWNVLSNIVDVNKVSF